MKQRKKKSTPVRSIISRDALMKALASLLRDAWEEQCFPLSWDGSLIVSIVRRLGMSHVLEPIVLVVIAYFGWISVDYQVRSKPPTVFDKGALSFQSFSVSSSTKKWARFRTSSGFGPRNCKWREAKGWITRRTLRLFLGM